MLHVMHLIALEFRRSGVDHFALKPEHREELRRIQAARSRSSRIVPMDPWSPATTGSNPGRHLAPNSGLR